MTSLKPLTAQRTANYRVIYQIGAKNIHFLGAFFSILLLHRQPKALNHETKSQK
jgi:hypothetical protein